VLRFMLDTDSCSFIMKRSNAGMLEKLRTVPPADVCMSVITKSELRFGVEVSPRREKDEQALDALLKHVLVLDLSEDASDHYGRIRTDLEKRGKMIGANDLFIAAHALSQDLTLVTNNTDEFGCVEGLSIENWLLRPNAVL
jgi:tRNA(fMet)-specific endonuclease VapC